MVPKEDVDTSYLLDDGDNDGMFKNVHPQNGVTIKEIILPRNDHDQRVSFGMVKGGNEYGLQSTKRMSRSQYNLLRSRSNLTQRKVTSL